MSGPRRWLGEKRLEADYVTRREIYQVKILIPHVQRYGYR